MENKKLGTIKVKTIKLGNKRVGRKLKNIANLVKEGKNIILACWCSPKPCHADTYKERIEELAGIKKAWTAKNGFRINFI